MSRVILITGASSGIGRATAELFAARGWAVVLASRSAQALEQTAASLSTSEVLTVPVDVADDGAVRALFDAAVERFGRVDVVVHSAAGVGYGRFEAVPPEVFDRLLLVNIGGTAHVTRAALQQFRRQGGGHLVALGSVLGKVSTPYMSPYITTKWAVHGLIRAVQMEAREIPGVSVSLVSPGGVNTPIYTQAANYTGRQGGPPPPVVSPHAVARAVWSCVRRPRRERSVGPANWLLVFGFRVLPAVYDRIVGPAMRLFALTKRPMPPHVGNVFEPRPDGESTEGPWGRLGALGRRFPSSDATESEHQMTEVRGERGAEQSSTTTPVEVAGPMPSG